MIPFSQRSQSTDSSFRTRSPSSSSTAPKRQLFHFARDSSEEMSEPDIQGDVSGDLFRSIPSGQPSQSIVNHDQIPLSPIPSSSKDSNVKWTISGKSKTPAAKAKPSNIKTKKQAVKRTLANTTTSLNTASPIARPEKAAPSHNKKGKGKKSAAKTQAPIDSISPSNRCSAKTQAPIHEISPSTICSASPVASIPATPPPRSPVKSSSKDDEILEKMNQMLSFMRDTTVSLKDKNQKVQETNQKVQETVACLDKLESQDFRGFAPDHTSSQKSKAIKSRLKDSANSGRKTLLPLGRHYRERTPSPVPSVYEEEDDCEYDQRTDSELSEPEPEPQQAVTFASPRVQRLGIDKIPEGWQMLKDGMALGEDPGSIIFGNGDIYGPQSVEVDVETYERPIWRFRIIRGVKARSAKGMIPVKEAYQSLVTSLSEEPMACKEWDVTPFHPPGSSSYRALTVGLDDSSVVASFFSEVNGWAKDIARGDKVTWDEASCPANIIPDSFSHISPLKFAKVFGRSAFKEKDHHSLFNCRRLPSLPKQALADEFARTSSAA